MDGEEKLGCGGGEYVGSTEGGADAWRGGVSGAQGVGAGAASARGTHAQDQSKTLQPHGSHCKRANAMVLMVPHLQHVRVGVGCLIWIVAGVCMLLVAGCALAIVGWVFAMLGWCLQWWAVLIDSEPGPRIYRACPWLYYTS